MNQKIIGNVPQGLGARALLMPSDFAHVYISPEVFKGQCSRNPCHRSRYSTVFARGITGGVILHWKSFTWIQATLDICNIINSKSDHSGPDLNERERSE